MLDAWLDLVHGSACVCCAAPGRVICARCRAELPQVARAARPTPCPTGLARAFAAGEYAGSLRALVVAHKEHRAFALAGPLGDLLALAVVRVLRVAPGPAVLVPIPSRGAVVRARGHDPMLRVTRRAASRLRADGLDVRVATLLRQRGPVADQAGLDARSRSLNLAETMAGERRAIAAMARHGRAVRVVLCDDVLTTGATAHEAQRALADSGIGVTAIACVAATRRRHPPLSFPSPGRAPVGDRVTG